MWKMGSTSDAQDSSTQFLGKEHSSYFNQRQTVSLREVNNEESTRHPTNNQPLSLQGYNPATDNPQTSAQNPQSPQKPPKRGRGWTGMPKGRPPGAKNKPKGPDHGLPKMSKKRGRPLGAKNKYPRGAHNAYPSTPDSNSSSIESGTPQTPVPIMIGTALVMAPTTPTEAQTTYTYPLGYAQSTSFSDSLNDDDRGWDNETGTWYSIKARAREELEIYGATSTAPEDFMRPMAMTYSPPPNSSYANQGDFGEPNHSHGSQYPPPPVPNHAFGSGIFAFGNGNSSRPYPSSSPYPGGMSAYSDPTQPPRTTTEYGRHQLQAPATSQPYNASSSVTDADNNFPRLRPYSTINRNLGTGAQYQFPAPATLGPFEDNNTTSSVTETENIFDKLINERDWDDFN
ncbi:hypothetical protein HO133_010287 [Letharia lupina]|uniref:Uncharacterized protein n=1 Tax=Letharia lupina TaxID=560253 RepID=A0A8H6CL36_9LECA|nr:uncharacterized protein HO133_010287 [Letharia lupina]KAF6225091.1 hypothetical protein HO133_010287 [Letharia lupina]